MQRFQLFFKNFQYEIRSFAFFTALLMVFRVAFIWLYSNQLTGNVHDEISMSLWYGFRLSLKTVAGISAIGIVFCMIPQLVWLQWPADRIRKWVYSIVGAVLTLLFCIRLPYYEIFKSGFNMMLINGANDDMGAILQTALREYGLIPRLGIAIILVVVVVYVLQKMLSLPVKAWVIQTKKGLIGWSAVFFVGIVVSGLFFRFGGAFTYKSSINWENAARLQSNLLNEAILDDAQALYRVRSIYERLKQATTIDFTVQELREKIALVGGNPYAGTIDEAFRHTIVTPMLAEQPQSVYFILGETYALWPFLPEYSESGDYVVREGKRMMAAANGTSTELLLANGDGTISGVNGFVTGMPNVGVMSNYEGVTFKETYGTGIGTVMKQMGYKTVFWYGGFGTWQNIRTYVLAQNFDEYYDAADIHYTGGNAWGAPDKDLFKRIEQYMDEHKGEKIFNFVLTTSNHPPYNIPLADEGFDAGKIKGHLPDTIDDTESQVNEIGHYWYQDHVIGEFFKRMEVKDPTMIVAITGDHSERFTFAKEVDARTFSSVPAIFYGQGIHHDWIPEHQYGVGYQMIPTLAKLVGRAGDTYDSIMPDLFSKNAFSFNHALWVDATGMHKQDQVMSTEQQEIMKAYRDIAVWRLKRGNVIQ